MLKNRNYKNSFILLIIMCFCLFTTVFGQKNAAENREAFQNQQRALNLSFYKNNIKSLEDAPMRCFVRKQIAEFIFAKKVKDYYKTAEDFTVDCLEDIDKNPKQFELVLKNFLANEMVFLLRNISTDTAEKARKKYLYVKNDGNIIDVSEDELSRNPDLLLGKVSAKLQKGEMPSNLTSIYLIIRRVKPEAVASLFDLLLKHYERLAITQTFDESFFSLSGNFLSDDVPIEIRKRFLRLTINLGQKAIAEDIDSKMFSSILSLSKWSLPMVEKLLPSSYPQALSVYTTLESRLSKSDKNYLEVYKRINESEDKLEQTIIEAEAAEDKELRDSLWISATRLALKAKKFRLAVDCLMKKDTDSEFDVGYKRQIMTDEILSSALKEKDFESAEYLIENLEDISWKGFGLLEISSEYLKLKNETKALEKLNEALRVLEKAGNDIHKVRNMLSASRLATKIENADAFEIASATIKVINKLPSLSPDDQLETESRTEYVSKVLMPNAFNLDKTFQVLAEKDVDFAYPISQGIQRKDLRLVAEIVVEMQKVYPYTPKLEKEIQK